MKSTANKGITLIALIITIIVMLILAGVVLNMVVNGGLIGQTEKAVTATELAQIKEMWEAARAERAHKKKAVLDLNEMIEWPSISLGKYENIESGEICWDDEYIYFMGEQQPDKDIAVSLGYKTELIQPENPSGYKIKTDIGYLSTFQKRYNLYD